MPSDLVTHTPKLPNCLSNELAPDESRRFGLLADPEKEIVRDLLIPANIRACLPWPGRGTRYKVTEIPKWTALLLAHQGQDNQDNTHDNNNNDDGHDMPSNNMLMVKEPKDVERW